MYEKVARIVRDEDGQFKVKRIRGGEHDFAQEFWVRGDATIGGELGRILPSLFPVIHQLIPSMPLLIEAGTGAGKTSAVLNTIVPYAVEHRQKVCFVSSRAAIGAQFKRSLAKQLSENHILTDYTPEGLRRLQEIGPVRVLTYHSLWAAICRKEEWLRHIQIVVFDEIHSLALDAPFVPFTGQLLDSLRGVFFCAVRIYLTATPKPILDPLFSMEGPRGIVRLCKPWVPRNFNLSFYDRLADVPARLNALPPDEKALVFIPTIAEGEKLGSQLQKPFRIISAATKQVEPDVWSGILESQHLDRPITLATATLDAGVSLTDPELKHIVCSGIDFNSVLQQAGRKRLRPEEKLNLYLWSPSRQQLGALLRRNVDIVSALELSLSNPHQFLREYILGAKLPQIRAMCDVSDAAGVQINHLALYHYLTEQDQLEEFLESENDHPLDSWWCKKFWEPILSDPSRWLSSRRSDETKQALRDWLTSMVGTEIVDKEKFGAEFKTLYQQAFGPRKNDRADRSWGSAVIRRVLKELQWGFSLEVDNGTWRIRQTSPAEADDEEMEANTDDV